MDLENVEKNHTIQENQDLREIISMADNVDCPNKKGLDSLSVDFTYDSSSISDLKEINEKIDDFMEKNPEIARFSALNADIFYDRDYDEDCPPWHTLNVSVSLEDEKLVSSPELLKPLVEFFKTLQ